MARALCYHCAVSPITFLRKLNGDPQLRNPDFRRFWASSILFNFGSQITLLALPICAALLLPVAILTGDRLLPETAARGGK